MSEASEQSPITTTIVPLAPTPNAVQVIYTNLILVLLVTIWTGLRFYSRKMRRLPFGAEDYLYMASVILFYAFVVFHFLMQFLGGAGHHVGRLQAWHVEKLMKFGYASQVMYALSLGSLKISICWMLQRIYFVRPFKIAAWITMGLALAWTVMTILIGLLICRLIAMQWNPTIPGGVCGDQITAFATVGVVDLVVDVIIFVLPLPMVLRLQVSRAHRVALMSIFGAGILTIVFGALRLASVFAVDFNDFSYTSPTAMVWSSAEVGVALMVSSSPTLRPVFDRIFIRFISSVRSGAIRTDPGLKYYNGGKSSKTRPLPLITAAKHPSRGGNGFMVMRDSDDNLELGAIHIRAGGQALGNGKENQRYADSGLGDAGSDRVSRDDTSTDSIFAKTEIVQKRE